MRISNNQALSFIICLLLLSTHELLAGPEIPGADQDQPIALVGGKIFTASGDPIENGTIVFDKGKIVAVGTDVAIPEGAEKIDVSGKHIYPGFFNADGDIGLLEINAVRATNDTGEVGRLNPNVQAQQAVNPDSEIIPVTRSGGVLLSLTSPSGGLVAGTSAVLQLDGWSCEDMTLKAPIAMHINWPFIRPARNWWDDESVEEQRKERDEAFQQLHELFDEARAHAKRTSANKDDKAARIDIRLAAMKPVLDKEVPIIAYADDIEQIQTAVAFAEQEDVRLIIYGGYEAEACKDLLVKHDIPVIISGIHRLPPRAVEPYDAPFTLPLRLQKAGIRYCIAGSGRFGASNLRNLPNHAGHAIAFGLDTDEALRAITLYPAQILGVDELVGSLEKGKQATLIVSNGDMLDGLHRVESAYVQGRKVDLSDRQKKLWNKYRTKYERMGLDETAAKTKE